MLDDRARHARRTVLASWALALVALQACGCSSYWPMSEDLQEAIRSEATLSPAVTDDEAVAEKGREAAEGSMAYPEAFSLPERLTLDEYISAALLRNPRIQAAVRNIEALGLRVPQVTSLSDPMLNFVPPTGQMIQTAAGMMGASVGVSQAVPFPWKLEAMGRVAEQVVRVGLENLRAIRLAVVSEVKKSYYAFYLTTASIQVTRENQALLERLRDVADARYRAGDVSQQDVLRAEVELYDLSNLLLTLEQERRTAMARLNNLMDRDVRADLPDPEPFDPARVEWKLQELMARADELSPELKAVQERTKRDLEAARLARLQYFPDFVVGGGYSFISSGGISPVANGEDAWNLNLGMTLPIWLHRIRAGILQRNAEILESSLLYRGARNDLFFALQDLSARVDTDYRSAVLFRDAIVPRARQAVEVSEKGYQAGKLDFLTLIDNWRKLLDYTLRYYETITSLERNFAELERLAGGELTRTNQAVRP